MIFFYFYLRKTWIKVNLFSSIFNIYIFVKSEILLAKWYFFLFCFLSLYEPGCIPAFYREVYEKICSSTSGNVEREVFKSLLVKSQLSSSVLSQVCLFFVLFLSLSPCRSMTSTYILTATMIEERVQCL